MKVLVINGPNLNMLGKRDKAQYSSRTYQELLDMISEHAAKINADVDFYQSNHEGAIIDRLQAAMEDGTDALIINAGAYTHYSYAIHDALEIINIPKIEVHISNIYEREAFRAHSVITEVCTHSIVGEGFEGYLHALDVIKEALSE